MKSTILTLILSILIQFCLATEKIQLPEEPWRAIVFMEKYNPGRWENNISIKLFGSYSPSDFLMLENSIKILNELSETVQLSLSNHERGNLEIFFLDSTNENVYESIIVQGKDILSSSSMNYNLEQTKDTWAVKSIRHYNLSVRLAMIQQDSRQNYLTNILAYALYPKTLSIEYRFKNGREVFNSPNSIFNQKTFDEVSDKWIDYEPYSDISSFDRQIIKTVYTSNFPKLLPIAKKQFDKVPSWLRKNSKKIIVFPFILSMFLFTGLIILFYKKLGTKIKNRLLQFNLVSVLALLIVGILISVFYIMAIKIGDPYFSFFNKIDIVMSILILIVLGLPALNVIRLIELAIHRNAHHKYFKVLLLFLSTSLIPSVTVFSITYFATGKKILPIVMDFLFTLFLAFTIIGIIRALVSFFILSQKEIKIENDLKISALRELKSKAELNALHSKINPHFLYNALNSIAGLAKTDAEKTEQMALSLSKLFRYSINKVQSDWSSFSDEMEMVRIYLDIEKVRFDDRLEFTIDLPDELKSVKVPRFIIQPLVENAVKHGISKLVTKAEISALVRRNGKWIEIAVADNGPDFPRELAPGFGLQSIYDKLEIMYPNRFEMHFLNAPDKHILIKLG